MTEDQELMWDMLTADPTRLAHRFGQELLELSKIRGRRQFKKRADEAMHYVMTNVSDPLSVVCIVKTWLTHYQLPFEPDRMESFDRFHNNYGLLVVNQCKNNSIQVL